MGQRPGGKEDLARELHLSTRRLQRRLAERGINFQRLLDDARRELARHYLLHSSRELNETAYLLVYEDANSFFRAFHHWEGTSSRTLATAPKAVAAYDTIKRRRSVSKYRAAW